jgi:hypothetical protein
LIKREKYVDNTRQRYIVCTYTYAYVIELDSLDTLLSPVAHLSATPTFFDDSSFIVIIRIATFKAPRFRMACDLDQNLQHKSDSQPFPILKIQPPRNIHINSRKCAAATSSSASSQFFSRRLRFG